MLRVMSTALSLPKILIDADVFSHFYKGGRTDLLNHVFPGRLAIVDTVLTELSRHPKISLQLTQFITVYSVEKVTFPVQDDRITMEYATLSRSLDGGESACLAVARYRGDYIASSNLKDIKTYCQKHNIQYYTTMDILHLAVEQSHLTEAECDTFIHLVKSRNSRLPCNTYQEYLQRSK